MELDALINVIVGMVKLAALFLRMAGERVSRLAVELSDLEII